MNPVIPALLVGLAVLGLMIAVLGFLPAPVRIGPKTPNRLLIGFLSLRVKIGRKRMIIIALGFLGGLILWALTGWIAWMIIVPALCVGIPYLLGSGPETEKLNRLEGLETWTRGLAGLTIAGAGLEQTIISSVGSSPDSIRDEIGLLAARLNARWPTRSALYKFADDLADPTGDLIVAHLLLAERVRGAGLANALEDLAQSISEEVTVRRKIEADRARPRQTVRITVFATVGLLALLPFVGQFMAPYKTPFGQFLLLVWVAVDGLMLLWLKKITTGKPTPRILVPTTAPRLRAVADDERKAA